MSFLGFDGVEDLKSNDFSPIPDGEYNLYISDTKYFTSQAGNPYLAVNFQVADGPHANRIIFEGYSMNNPIGMGKLKQMIQQGLKAPGIHDFPDSPGSKDYPAQVASIHGGMLKGRVITKPDNRGTPRNQIASYGPAAQVQPKPTGF